MRFDNFELPSAIELEIYSSEIFLSRAGPGGLRWILCSQPAAAVVESGSRHGTRRRLDELDEDSVVRSFERTGRDAHACARARGDEETGVH